MTNLEEQKTDTPPLLLNIKLLRNIVTTLIIKKPLRTLYEKGISIAVYIETNMVILQHNTHKKSQKM